MKGKKFYIALIGVFIIGIGSFFIYRQQQETRSLEFEGYEITSIERRVDALYNEDKTDIQENITAELADLEQVFLELEEKNLSYRSEKQIKSMEKDFLKAQEMYELQEDILELFREKNVVQQDTSTDSIEQLQTSLIPFEDKTVYYKRNDNLLTDARVQVETIEKATKLVQELTIDGRLNEEINEAELEKLEELVNQIKDETIKENLLKQIGVFHLALNEIEEELSLEEETEEVEEDETLEEENVEIVQEADQRTEETIPSVAQNNTQSQISNNNRTNSSLAKKPSSSSSNSQTSSQNNNQSNITQQKPTVTKKYQETKVIKEIPYQTLVYENSNIPKGEEIVYNQGSQGAVTETYEVIIYSDGTSDRKKVSNATTEPVNRVVTIGTKED